MRQEVIDILDKLKQNGIKVSAVEKQLGFGNGLLAKIIKDPKRNLSPDKMQRLKEYWQIKEGHIINLESYHKSMDRISHGVHLDTEQNKVVIPETNNLHHVVGTKVKPNIVNTCYKGQQVEIPIVPFDLSIQHLLGLRLEQVAKHLKTNSEDLLTWIEANYKANGKVKSASPVITDRAANYLEKRRNAKCGT